ncbi:MAG: GMC family oxidoreductase [Candidatus Dadabacteria bacterium]|nr:MAG: GMC family oxidoreductase [Candidatus Dadabacteria bacterium]
MSLAWQQTDDLPVQTAATIGSGPHRLSADVVVVGSGAGGAVMAYELAREGRSVIVLEAGPFVPSSRFTERYPQMMERLYQDRGGQRNEDGDLLVLQGSCVGGSTVVNAAAAFRTPEYVLRDWREKFGLSDMTSEALDPWFTQVEQRLSVHVNAPHEINQNNQVIMRGCDKLGVSWRPLARNIKNCALTGFCLAGCASDRKQSMLVTYLPWAMHHGAQVIADTRVERIRHKNGKATGVVATTIDPKTGRKVADVEVEAKLVVVAAGAVQSPLLLTRSGLTGQSGQVGRNFACHPSVGILADFDEEIFGWRGATLGAYCDEWDHPDRGGFILEFAMAGADFMAAFSPGIADKHLEFMGRLKNVAGMISLIHDENAGVITTNDRGEKAIRYRVTQKDRETIRTVIKRSAEIYFAAGANKVFVPTYAPTVIEDVKDIDRIVDALDLGPGTIGMTSYHPQGTCRMGANPQNSVVGPDGQFHGVERLYVADASLFPTSIMVNPQMTVYALSSKIAHGINEQGSELFGN